MPNAEDAGLVGGVNVTLPILMIMVSFLSIALYNVIEITFLIFAVFKHRSGLYFWSFIVATWGIAPHAIGFILKFFQVTTLDLLSSAIVGVGWAGMVIGQSVVLYSRLHLVVRDKARIRWVLYMIIFNGVVLGVPLFTLAMGSNSKASAHFLPGLLVYDKVQIVIISVQETIISVIYIHETMRLLAGCGNSSSSSDGNNNNGRSLQKLLRHLILVNVVVLIFDISLLAVQFAGHYEIQTTYKTAVYSIKLKIEFSVLNGLVAMVSHEDLLCGNLRSNSLSLNSWKDTKRTKSGTSTQGPAAFTVIEEEGKRDDSRKNTFDINVSRSVDDVDVDNNMLGFMLADQLASPGSVRSSEAILPK
jgi:hypothetical protein